MSANACVIKRGVLAALGAPPCEMRQLGAQHRRLQRVEPAVVADFVVEVMLRAAVHPEALQAVGESSSCVTIMPPSP